MRKILKNGVLGIAFLFVSTMLTSAMCGTINVSAISLSNEQELAVKNYTDNSNTTIKARFDGNIPFVELGSLYHLLFSDNIATNLIEPGVYEVTTKNGKATINTINDSLHSDNFSNFIASSDPNDSSDDENVPKMIKGLTHQVKGSSVATDIDFTKYGVDFYAENDKIWLPAATGFNIFMKMGFYDGTTLNIMGNNSEISATAEYKAKLQNLFNNKQRFGEYTKQSYGGLCFIFDVFYGYPEKSQLGESIKKNGLDYTLKTYNDETRLIRDWLLSEDLVEYYAGLVALDAALYDGGHTNLADTFKYDFLLEAYPGLATDESYELYKDLEFYKSKPINYWFRITKISDTRESSLGSEKYTEKGDTAIYSFDKFDFDMLGWNRYYENGGEYPNDTLGGILKALDRALENPSVKNFVFDVSNNSGGMAFVAPVIMNYLGYDNMLREKNIITGQIEEIGFKIDINRDGIYDENDKVSKYNFNYGVLTSEFTFSTGNLFAAMAKDNDFAILGETSGGGACNIITYNTSEGVIYTMSALSCSQNKRDESVDLGVIPDYDLIQIVDEKKDYTKFYNLDILSSLLNDFYKKQSDDSEHDSGSDDSGHNSSNNDSGYGSSNVANTKNKKKNYRSNKQTELSLVDDVPADGASKEDVESNNKNDKSKTTSKKPEVELDKQAESEAEKTPENNLVFYIVISGVGLIVLIGVGLYIRKKLSDKA